jgi:hypothetical protein
VDGKETDQRGFWHIHTILAISENKHTPLPDEIGGGKDGARKSLKGAKIIIIIF